MKGGVYRMLTSIPERIVMENGKLFCWFMDIVYDNYRLRLS